MHRNIEIILVISGSGAVISNGRTYNVSEGDMVIFNSYSVHEIPQGEERLCFICFIIDADFCFANGIPVDSVRFEDFICKDEKASGLFNDVLKQYAPPFRKETLITRVRIALLKLLLYLRESHTFQVGNTVGKDNTAFRYTQKAIHYMCSRLYEHIRIEDVAKYVGVNPVYLSRVFKKATGKTIVEFLNIIRCNEAKALITNGVPVSEAAFACSFDSLPYFSRTFMRYMGTLPSKVKQ